MRSIKLSVFPALVAALALGACAEDEPAEELETPVAEAPMAAPVTPVADAGFAEWDVDRDVRLASAEFGTWMGGAGIYDRWAGEDEGIDAGEFGEGALGIWDTDNDARLTEAEWREGATGWFGDRDFGTFGDWDLNDNEFLEGNELGEGFERTGLYGDWDLNDNELLEENEFGEGAFGVWDANDDMFVDEAEWGAEYGEWGI